MTNHYQGIRLMFMLLLGLLLCTATAFSQLSEKKVIVNNVNINAKPEIEYIQLTGVMDERSKLEIEVDYGQQIEGEQVITGSDGEPREFESMMGVLNFLYQNGWEFVNAYQVQSSDGIIYNFILRRRED